MRLSESSCPGRIDRNPLTEAYLELFLHPSLDFPIAIPTPVVLIYLMTIKNGLPSNAALPLAALMVYILRHSKVRRRASRAAGRTDPGASIGWRTSDRL